MIRWFSVPLLLVCWLLVPLEAQEKDKDKPQEKDKVLDKDAKDKGKDKEKAQPKAVQIKWYGQSFFTIRSSKGTVIVTDPHQIPIYGRPIGDNAVNGDIVTVSHNHSDHNQIKAVDNIDTNKEIKVIYGITSNGKKSDWNIIDEKIKDVRIKTVGCYHDNMEGLQKGKNTIFIFEMDGWRIVHLGDLGHPLTPLQIRQIGPVDVLMIPCGGVYSLNGTEAKDVVEQLKPKEYIFPMHYGTKIYLDLLPPDEFLDGVEKKRIVVSADNRINLNKDPQRPRPLIVQLNCRPKQ